MFRRKSVGTHSQSSHPQSHSQPYPPPSSSGTAATKINSGNRQEYQQYQHQQLFSLSSEEDGDLVVVGGRGGTSSYQSQPNPNQPNSKPALTATKTTPIASRFATANRNGNGNVAASTSPLPANSSNTYNQSATTSASATIQRNGKATVTNVNANANATLSPILNPPPAPPSLAFSDVDGELLAETASFSNSYNPENEDGDPEVDPQVLAQLVRDATSDADIPPSVARALVSKPSLAAKKSLPDINDGTGDALSDVDVQSLLSSPDPQARPLSPLHPYNSAGNPSATANDYANLGLTPLYQRRDKAAQILGIPHRRSMEPIPSTKVAHRLGSFGSRSATGGYTNPHPTIPEGVTGNGGGVFSVSDGRRRAGSGLSANGPGLGRTGLVGSGFSAYGYNGKDDVTPLTSLYLVAGLPKSHHAWTLADPDSVLGLQHSEGAVNKWWRPEVLGSTVSPGVASSSSSKNAGGDATTPIASANATGAGAGGAGTSAGQNQNLASSSASLNAKERRRKRSNTQGTLPIANPRDPGAGIGLNKSQVAKMLSKSLKLSFTREVEIVASTLQPPSTVHTFTFTLPTPPDKELGLPSAGPNTGGGLNSGWAGRSNADVRSSVYSATTNGRDPFRLGGGPSAMGMIPSARPSSTYLGPATTPLTPAAQEALQAESANATTYYGVCLTVWSHADEERTLAIRRTVEMGRGGGPEGSVRRARKGSRKRRESDIPPVPSLTHLKADGNTGGNANGNTANRGQGSNASTTLSATTAARNLRLSNPSNPWSGTEAETDDAEFNEEGEFDQDDGETDNGAMSESDWEGRGYSGGSMTGANNARGRNSSLNTNGGGGANAAGLFVGGDQNTIFWLPYALTLVSRMPIYDLMRDFLTFSWARFSKDVHSHTLQIAKILSAPVPKPGELIKLDASPSQTATTEKERPADKSGKAVASGATLEMVCRMPGGLDFGKGLVDVNFQMWPLFCCLSLDNILTCCEIALSPTGRVLFISRHPAMLGIAVSTIKYLVELRGWSGIALPSVHSRDAKIYIEDPGPWIIGLATEARYLAHTAPEVCICDLDINYVNCLSPPPGHISTKGQRDKYRRMLLTAFDAYFHPDHSVPSEFKEAFPAGRFRPVVKIQSRRGASSSVGTEVINPPEWWNWTRVVAAFNEVLQDRDKPLSLLKRITKLRGPRKQAKLSPAELLIQLSLRKRASAFVDARDDLETKIGRLSRRLNFLLTESDLWREKFVQFEAYAEKLSTEAVELRNKINKEQRESRRLTSIVTLTAQEKAKLQLQLHETESAHRAAAIELDKMRNNMEKIELERTQMVAEVEAQIERALQSMMVGDSDMEWDEDDLDEIDQDGSVRGRSIPQRSFHGSIGSIGGASLSGGSLHGYGSSDFLAKPPLSPRSVGSAMVPRSRKKSIAARPARSESGRSTKGSRLRTTETFDTTATLAEIADKLEAVKAMHHSKIKSRNSSLHGHGSERSHKLKVHREEVQKVSDDGGDEDSSLSEKERAKELELKKATRRFSNGAAEGSKDGTSGGDGMMSAVDAGIVEKSDRIAEKMKQIQERFETALAAEEAAAIAGGSGSEPEVRMDGPEDDKASGSEPELDLPEEDRFQPAPLTSISPRPRPSRAARPPPPRAKSRDVDTVRGSVPSTPTASISAQALRVVGGSTIADTEAWRDSVLTATAQSDEVKTQWRESTITATNPPSVEQHVTVSNGGGLKPPVEGDEDVFMKGKGHVPPPLRRIASGASVGALKRASPTPHSAHTPSTMNSDSMSSGAPHNVSGSISGSRFRPESRGGITTDDDDADFQSAYSNSPRMTEFAGDGSELERSASVAGRNSAMGRRKRDGSVSEKRQTFGLGLSGVNGANANAIAVSRSRASSVGTAALDASNSGSDYTVGAGEVPSSADTTRPSHPPVSLGGRNAASLANSRPRKDSDSMIQPPPSLQLQTQTQLQPADTIA